MYGIAEYAGPFLAGLAVRMNAAQAHRSPDGQGVFEDPAAASGFTVEKLDPIEGSPEYLRMIWPPYLLGAARERLVNSWDGLAMFRVLLVGELRKV